MQHAVTKVAAGAVVACAVAISTAWAQEQTVYPEPERCPRFIAENPWPMLHDRQPVVKASFTQVQAAGTGEVRIAYLGHSTFLITSPAGVTIATDYNDAVRPSEPPTVATMNRAHITHYSVSPDPAIEHVLRGWGTESAPADHDLTVRDVWIRNVTTNLRGNGFDGDTAVRRDMNSMFVFEVSGLCIAHLGHLHHELTEEHLDALGRIDVVLVPVDGSRTLGTRAMVRVLQDIQAPLVIPMHFFGETTLSRFIDLLDENYDVKRTRERSVLVSREGLPRIPTLLILGR